MAAIIGKATFDQVIPEAAVEAAARVLYLEDHLWDDPWETAASAEKYRTDARIALEAAAPHMKRLVTTLAELDALPEGSIVRTESYSLYVKDQIRVGPTSWWVTTNERHDFSSADIELPVMVLHEP